MGRVGARVVQAGGKQGGVAMWTRTILVGVSAALVLSPAAAWAQGLTIDHSSVGCIVAGKYPKMNACFEPAGSLAKARVYFRVEATPDWYYVEMDSDAPCHAGFLPKPSKKLIDQKLEYYVQATDKAFAEGQTQTYAARVVGSADECDKDVPVAPFVSKASVAVFPGMPAGFAGAGLPVGIVAGAVAGGAAVAGGVVAVTNDDSTTTTSQGAATTTQPAATTTTTQPATTTTSTTVPIAQNSEPQLRLRVNGTNCPASGCSISGTSPFTVNFNMCQSTDADGDTLHFEYRFGDGTGDSGPCQISHTYTASFAEVVSQIENGAMACTVDLDANGNPLRGFELDPRADKPFCASCCNGNIKVSTTNPDPCAGDPAPPEVALTSPAAEGFKAQAAFPIPFRSSVTSGASVPQVEYYGEFYEFGLLPAPTLLGTGPAPNPYPFNLSESSFCSQFGFSGSVYGEFEVYAKARDICGGEGISDTVIIYTAADCGPSPSPSPSPTGTVLFAPTSRLAWTSVLDIPGAKGQTVLNGSSVFFPGQGRSMSLAVARDGENRIEAQLIEATGPGTWRFEFLPGSLKASSLRVVAGNVVSVEGDSIAFQLKGEPGERVVFAFKPER